LVVEPDGPTAEEVVDVLGGDFRTVIASSGAGAIEHLAVMEADLVLLAFSLPDGEGLDICRRLHDGPVVPVIFVAGLDAEGEALASYAAGADRYILKPYRLRELEARVRAALRRAPATIRHDGGFSVGDVTVYLERHQVVVRERVVRLPLREFELLAVLIMSAGKVWSRESLMRRIWRETPASGTKSLDVHVRRIRTKIEDDPSQPTHILTVRGVGYRYAPETASAAGVSLDRLALG
jgi:two-component system response regulator RegX3